MALRFDHRYPATVNRPAETGTAADAPAAVVGADHVDHDVQPTMGAEDFAYLLREKPGCYIFIGNGTEKTGAGLHNPHYDFNDAILPIGSSCWTTLVERVLARQG